MNKKFKSSLLPILDLQDKIIDGKRWYFLPSGQAFKSVTTIIGERTDKSHLIKWKKRVGHEEAANILAKAGIRGTAIHSMAEKYLQNDPNYKGKEGFENIETFLALKDVLDKHVDNIRGNELPLFSRTLKCAGRTDLVAHYDDVNSIVDFKTSLKKKKEEWIENYFIQATVYSLMTEFLYKIHIPQIVIIIAVDGHSEAQVFVKNRDDYVDKVMEIFTGE